MESGIEVVHKMMSSKQQFCEYRPCGGHALPEGTKEFWPVLSVGAHSGVVVKALRYKPAGRGFDSR
jgi:hypothetical protein